jgi:hypothetical protein
VRSLVGELGHASLSLSRSTAKPFKLYCTRVDKLGILPLDDPGKESGPPRHVMVILRGASMKVAQTIFAVLLAAALSGCADYQAQQQAAQIKGQNKAAMRDCKNKFSTVTPQNIVAAAQCRNAAMAITLPLLGSNQDLAQRFMAQRLAIAEKVQKGKLTVAEGSAAIWQKYSEAESELQRRIQTAAAQRQTPAAQQNTADAQLSTDTSAAITGYVGHSQFRRPGNASQATGALLNGGAMDTQGKADAATQISEEKNTISGPDAWPSPFQPPTGASN